MKDPLKDYEIRHVGLKTGFHDFHWKIGNEFFANFEYAMIEQGSLDVALRLNKKENEMEFHYHFTGSVQISCDRCLDNLGLPVDFTSDLLVKNGNPDDSTDEIIYLPDNVNTLTVADYILELLTLHLPLRKVCGENNIPDCGRNFEDQISQFQNENEDEESTDNSKSDPRWDALRQLKFK